VLVVIDETAVGQDLALGCREMAQGDGKGSNRSVMNGVGGGLLAALQQYFADTGDKDPVAVFHHIGGLDQEGQHAPVDAVGAVALSSVLQSQVGASPQNTLAGGGLLPGGAVTGLVGIDGAGDDGVGGIDIEARSFQGLVDRGNLVAGDLAGLPVFLQSKDSLGAAYILRVLSGQGELRQAQGVGAVGGGLAGGDQFVCGGYGVGDVADYALFLVAVVLSVMGAAYFTVLAFLAPITMAICEESKMDKLTGAVAINCGALAGGNFPTAALGVVFRGLIDTAYEADPSLTPLDSFSTEMTIFGFAIVFSLILITIFRFGFKENRNIGKGITFRKPEPFEPKQRTTLNLMILMMVVVLVFPVLKMILPSNELIASISGKIDVGLVAMIFTVIALLLDLAPQKEIIAKVPWNTILMIAGAGMLIAVAVEAGTIEQLSAWIGDNVPVFLVPIAFSIVAAFMSFFSSTTGVVTPALFPLIPALAASTGLSPAVLFACTVLGAQSSAISPFSSGGSLILGSYGNDEERNKLFNRLLFVAVPISVCVSAVYNFAVAMIL